MILRLPCGFKGTAKISSGVNINVKNKVDFFLSKLILFQCQLSLWARKAAYRRNQAG